MKTTVNTLFTVLAVLLSLHFCSGQSAYHPNNYLVTIDPNATQAEIDQTLSELNSVEIWISPVSGTRLWSVINFPVYGVNGEPIININDLGTTTQSKPIINDFGLDYIVKYFPSVTESTYDSQMDCDGSLSTFTETGPNRVRIGIFDTGCSYPENSSISNYYFDLDSSSEYDFVNDDSIADDENGHGTHITSIIAHTINKFAGVNGDHFPKVHFGIAKCIKAEGNGDLSTVLLAFERALEKGMKVANMSFSFRVDPSYAYSHPFYEVIKQSRDEYGILIIASAGNSNYDIDLIGNSVFPASYDLDNIISVASFDCVNQLSEFSNYGNVSVDLAGPGIDIPGLNVGLDGSPLLENLIVAKSGTSQSTAIVSGIAAILATHQKPFDYELTKCAILNSADYYPQLAELTATGGVINANEALQFLLNDCDPPYSGGGFENGDIDNVILNNDNHNLFPNPNNGNFFLSLDSRKNQTILITLTDNLGQIIYSKTYDLVVGSNRVQINFPQLSQGSYQLSYVIDKKYKSERLVILR